MKHLNINTTLSEIGLTYNNGRSFPVFSGSTNFDFHSTSSINTDTLNQCQVDVKNNYYCICLDWLEFICQWDEPIELAFINNNNPDFVVEKISVHRNPNFRNLHRVYYNGFEVCEIYSTTNNGTHACNEVSVKIANALLYTDSYYTIIRDILEKFGLTFNRMARIDIALDGNDILKILALLTKYIKSYTIQTSNDAIQILPTAFKKKDLSFLGWSIGKGKSGISARVYNKSEEIVKTKKTYIADYWSNNGITTETVGRFEIQLTFTRLKKYNLDLSSIEKLSDAVFLASLFTNEVKPWLKFYRVRKKDYLNHKKEVAIKKGKEISYIKWDELPVKTELLEFSDFISDRDRTNARNTISFLLKDIHRNPTCTTTAQVEVIQMYMNNYDLKEYVTRKIDYLFCSNVEYQYNLTLKNLVLKE